MSKEYGKWTIKQLKDELRRRNAKTFGRKSDLVSRLQDYDANFNFRPSTEPSTSTSSQVQDMILPEVTTYKDMNATTISPKVTTSTVNCYLSLSCANKQLKGQNLYQEKYLLCIRSVIDNKQYFVKARCGAEMKKHIVYTVDIKLSLDGAVEEGQCECGAGMGPSAHCKHVIATLHALVDFSKGKDIILNETCTSRLQTFHQVKKFKGSPIKAQNLKLRESNMTPISTLSSFDPRPQSFRNQPNYRSDFKNTCIGFSATQQSKMPILQLFPPANLYAFHNDHNYLSSTPEQDFLQRFNLESISEEVRLATERKTRGQSSNPEWMRERSVRLCSSSFGRICKATDRTNLRSLAITLASPGEQIFSEPLNHGRKHENTAAKVYEKIVGKTVQECGLFISSSHPFMASSPDRVIDDTSILEIKCPWVARNKCINPETVDYLYLGEDDGLYHLNQCHIYYYQIQGQLFCANRSHCHLMIWTFEDSVVVNVKRDNNFITHMVSKLSTFYEDHFKKVLVDKHFYHDYGKYF